MVKAVGVLVRSQTAYCSVQVSSAAACPTCSVFKYKEAVPST
jgi:hypothetical protein